MTTPMPETAEVGELVEAAFDQAARYATDPEEVSRLATRAVMNMLLRGRRAPATGSAPSRRNSDGGLRRADTRRADPADVITLISNVRVEEGYQS